VGLRMYNYVHVKYVFVALSLILSVRSLGRLGVVFIYEQKKAISCKIFCLCTVQCFFCHYFSWLFISQLWPNHLSCVNFFLSYVVISYHHYFALLFVCVERDRKDWLSYLAVVLWYPWSGYHHATELVGYMLPYQNESRPFNHSVGFFFLSVAVIIDINGLVWLWPRGITLNFFLSHGEGQIMVLFVCFLMTRISI